MSDDIQRLIASLRLGDYQDPTEKIGLLSAALIEHAADATALLSLLRAPQIPLCLAAIGACTDRTEPELMTALLGLSAHSEARVRQKLVEVLAKHTQTLAVEALKQLAEDKD